jgi:hypothetical protein
MRAPPYSHRLNQTDSEIGGDPKTAADRLSSSGEFTADGGSPTLATTSRGRAHSRLAAFEARPMLLVCSHIDFASTTWFRPSPLARPAWVRRKPPSVPSRDRQEPSRPRCCPFPSETLEAGSRDPQSEPSHPLRQLQFQCSASPAEVASTSNGAWQPSRHAFVHAQRAFLLHIVTVVLNERISGIQPRNASER